MGWLACFGIINRFECTESLKSDIYILEKSILGYLYNNIYRHKFSKDESMIWSQAVLDTLLLTDPKKAPRCFKWVA